MKIKNILPLLLFAYCSSEEFTLMSAVRNSTQYQQSPQQEVKKILKTIKKHFLRNKFSSENNIKELFKSLKSVINSHDNLYLNSIILPVVKDVDAACRDYDVGYRTGSLPNLNKRLRLLIQTILEKLEENQESSTLTCQTNQDVLTIKTKLQTFSDDLFELSAHRADKEQMCKFAIGAICFVLTIVQVYTLGYIHERVRDLS